MALKGDGLACTFAATTFRAGSWGVLHVCTNHGRLFDEIADVSTFGEAVDRIAWGPERLQQRPTVSAASEA